MGSTPPVEETSPTDEDVLEEELAVKQQNEGDDVDKSVAVQVRGLTKTYPGTFNVGCCKCKRTSPYHAVKVSFFFSRFSLRLKVGRYINFFLNFVLIIRVYGLISPKTNYFVYLDQMEQERRL
jgi:hypothetical protein